tara:strand:- start:2933 stop:3469 length:537 start_codon:yes stop_codon:yes gene_type:complete
MEREIQNGLEGLSHETLVAISKLVDKAKLTAARESIDPGIHIIDLLLVGQLELEVKKDYIRKGTSRIPYTRVIAMLLQRAGVTGEASLKVLEEVLKEAHEMGKDSATELEKAVPVAKGLKAFSELVNKSLPPIDCKGATKVSSVGLVAQERRLTRSEAELLFPGNGPQEGQDEVADEA